MDRKSWVVFFTAVIIAVVFGLMLNNCLSEAYGQEAPKTTGLTGISPVNTNTPSPCLDLPMPPVSFGTQSSPLLGGSRGSLDDDPSDTPPPVFYGEEIETENDTIFYVLDRSSSMIEISQPYTDVSGEIESSGTRWSRAVSEASRSILGLPENFKFNVRIYDCGMVDWSKRLEEANKRNKKEAISWLRLQSPGGNTGTGPAVAEALKQNQDCLTFVLLTDGIPNCPYVYVHRVEKIKLLQKGKEIPTTEGAHRKMIRKENYQGATVNVFGIDARGSYRAFCQGVAADSGGTYVDVR